MADYYIFGFGLIVTLIVGSGLTAMILAHHRLLEQERQDAVTKADGKPVPVVADDRTRR